MAEGNSRGRLSKSVSERFERAKQEQLQREHERLESFRQVDARNKTTPRGSLASRWEEVLSESKDDEKKKFETQKRHTITTFLSAYEAGLVQRRISHYESLFMQIAASLEKIQATIHASKRKSLTRESIEPIHLANTFTEENSAIDFRCGTTQNYHFSLESPLRQLLSNCLVANQREPLPLLCGVYGMQDSPFEIVAVAMLDEVSEATDEPYIAITVNLSPQTEIFHEDEFFGIKKVAFFVSSSGDVEEKTLIWDPSFNILPPIQESILFEETTENLISQDHEFVLSTPERGSATMNEISESSYHDPVPSIQPVMPSGLPDKCDLLSTEGDDSNNLHGRGTGNYVSSSDSSIDEGDQTWKEVVPETEKNSSLEGDDVGPETQETGLIFSFAKAKGMPEVQQSTIVPAGDAPQRSNFTDSDVIPWTEAEVRTPPSLEKKSSQFDVSVREIHSFSCSPDSIVFRLKSGTSVIVISSLKYVHHSSYFHVCEDVVFEWVRGIAKSGWLYKWPMKNQKAGMMTRRFFILRDRILSYHRVEPSSQEEASADYSMHSVKLKKGHYVHRSKHHMRNCVKLDTVNDALWVRCRSKEEEDEWIAAIWEGINRYSRPSPFFWKSRMEVVWHHESPSFQCIGVDATYSQGRYSRAALYCSSLALSPLNPNKRLSRSNTLGQTDCVVPGEDAVYSLEFGTSVDNEVHLEVLNLSAATEFPRLLCLKILGDIIMIGGTHGYVGLAVVGAPARYRLEMPFSKKVSESGVCEVISRQYEGHQPEAHVLVISANEELSLFVSGDSLGGVALWKLRKRTGTAFIGSLKGRSLGGSRICAIEFTPQKTHLLIGTSKKLLLVGLWAAGDGSFRMEGLVEIENCEPHLSCFYSLSYPSTSDHLIVWKVVSEVADCAESISRVSLDGSDAITRPTMIHRYGIPSDTILTASKQLQPIVRYRDHDETSRVSLIDLQQALDPDFKRDSRDEDVPTNLVGSGSEPNDNSSPVKSSWRGTAKRQTSWKKK